MARRHVSQLLLLRSYGTFVRCSKIPPPTLSSLPHQERCQNHLNKRKMNHVHSKASPAETPIGIGSPARIQKLIASQQDPLLAIEIFDLASRQPNFRHSYSAFHTLILKLARARHFSLAQGLLRRLKTGDSPITPSLFSHLIRIYGDAQLPDKAVAIFYSIPQFNTRPLPKHLNLVLQVLVAHPGYLHPAFDLFKSAERYGISPNTTSYNILMRAFCFNGRLSIAYHLFNQMFQRDVVPDVESYRILMQGLCRRSQVNRAVDLLGDMLNKGFVPDTLSYTTLLNSLCRKKKLKEAYKLLCKMKVKGCNPDIVHYNTVILGLCREGRALDACKVLEDMASIGCLPNLVSYRSVVAGLCSQGMYHEAKNYTQEMISKGFSPHFSIFHALINGFCKVGKIDDACELLEEMLNNGETPHIDTWEEIIPRICDVDVTVKIGNDLEEVCKVDITPDTRIADAVAGLEEYLIRRIRSRCKGFLKTS
ncbi:pentatricopeptide repeat-containing protein At4g01400, mitochondrial-like [Diospyros lotus]|uniref:pentatricopeptide repeat-containing protein At4g01400, mitochondrial-like n=1 Tax=Diospyros lotus TaxID=55363 RepID=UPI00224ED5AD|nr:pentatricopeptide repeat-containing protein At4g01400, mitochondrial-like [Diospyros lotus]